jgi:3-hydroxyisobutyrate dehydrogenase
MNIGIVGLGRMGSRIAARLSEHGFAVTAWDRDATAVRQVEAAGVATAPDAASVAKAGELVITCVTEDHGAREVFTGAKGFFDVELSGKLFIEMSTLRPSTAHELAPMIGARGAQFIDSPVLGSLANVTVGTLQALVGGCDVDVARARPVLDTLARRVIHMGPVGCGYAMKLVANLGLAAYVQMLAESLALGEGQGLSLDVMLDVLSESTTANRWIATRRPILTGEANDVTLDIRTMRKDVMSALATGSQTDIPMPLAAGVLAAFSAAVASGWGDGDIGQMPRFSREAFVQRYT